MNCTTCGSAGPRPGGYCGTCGHAMDPSAVSKLTPAGMWLHPNGSGLVDVDATLEFGPILIDEFAYSVDGSGQLGPGPGGQPYGPPPISPAVGYGPAAYEDGPVLANGYTSALGNGYIPALANGYTSALGHAPALGNGYSPVLGYEAGYGGATAGSVAGYGGSAGTAVDFGPVQPAYAPFGAAAGYGFDEVGLPNGPSAGRSYAAAVFATSDAGNVGLGSTAGAIPTVSGMPGPRSAGGATGSAGRGQAPVEAGVATRMPATAAPSADEPRNVYGTPTEVPNRFSLVAFVLAGLALLVVPMGLAALTFASMARNSGEPLGPKAFTVSVAASLIGSLIGTAAILLLLV